MFRNRPVGDNKILQIMNEFDLSYHEFADVTGIPVRTLQNWVSRGSYPEWLPRILRDYVLIWKLKV